MRTACAHDHRRELACGPLLLGYLMPAFWQAAATSLVQTSATLALPSSNTICMFFLVDHDRGHGDERRAVVGLLVGGRLLAVEQLLARSTVACASSWNGL